MLRGKKKAVLLAASRWDACCPPLQRSDMGCTGTCTGRPHYGFVQMQFLTICALGTPLTEQSKEECLFQQSSTLQHRLPLNRKKTAAPSSDRWIFEPLAKTLHISSTSVHEQQINTIFKENWKRGLCGTEGDSLKDITGQSQAFSSAFSSAETLQCNRVIIFWFVDIRQSWPSS